MLSYLEKLIQPMSGWTDVLDVLLVTLVLYNLLLLIRGTRAVQVLLGILLLVVFYYTARAFNLSALETTLETFFLILPVAMIVLFQQEIRTALARFGRTPLLGFGTQQEVEDAFNDIAIAATTLAERRVGALIVIERNEGLRNYIENGIALDAKISVDLLISIFTPETPTHDGAAILQGDRIAAATCFLPLTRSSRLSTEFGTRHRAGLGISEETDALAIIVSEETGRISVALGGDMIRGLDSNDLVNLLYKSLAREAETPEALAA